MGVCGRVTLLSANGWDACCRDVQLMSRRPALFVGAVFPWMVGWLVYNARAFLTFVNYASLALSGALNFILPVVVWLAAHRVLGTAPPAHPDGVGPHIYGFMSRSSAASIPRLVAEHSDEEEHRAIADWGRGGRSKYDAAMADVPLWGNDYGTTGPAAEIEWRELAPEVGCQCMVHGAVYFVVACA